MFIRNGIMSNLRERGRTAVFSLLIVFLTITTILSISVLLYCRAVMDACDEAYRSIALIEYMGPEYPNEDEPYADYAEGAEIPEIFLRAAEQYRTMNNYVRIVPCRDVNDVYAFQQNELQLTEGSMPDPDSRYACVISADLAEDLSLGPGDVFSLDELRGTAEDRYALTFSGKKQIYSVSGVAGASYDYCGTVWVIAEDTDTPLFGYLLGTAVSILMIGKTDLMALLTVRE